MNRRNETGRDLVVRDNSSLMEYSPRDMAFVELNSAAADTVSVRDHFKILFRHKTLILATFIAVVGTVYLGLKMRTPIYEGNVKLLLRAEKLVESPYYRDLEGSLKTEAVLTQSEIVKSGPVLERTVRALKLDQRPADYEMVFASPLKKTVMKFKETWFPAKKEAESSQFTEALKNLREHIKVKPVANTNLFIIAVRDFDPKSAAEIANVVSRYYVVFDLEQQLAELSTKYGEKHLAVMQLRDDIQKFAANVDEGPNGPNSYIDRMGPASVKLIEEAHAPLEPMGFKSPIILILGALCGLCLGITLAFVFDHIDPTFRSADDVARSLNLSLLGSVPVRKFGTKLLTKDPVMPTKYGQSFQGLADQIHLAMRRDGIRSVLLTACCSGEGASVVAANLAGYLSRHLGHRVLMVDANFRNPSLHKLFKISGDNGFADVISGAVPLENAIWPINKRLDVLPAGKYESNPLTLFDTSNIAEIIRRAGEMYDIVLIDSAQLKGFIDTEILSTTVDGVAVVIEAGRSRRHVVRSILSSLEQKKINLLGVILNKRIFHVPDAIYNRI